MNTQQGHGNSTVAVVAIIVAGLLIAGAMYLFYDKNQSPGTPEVIEKNTTIIEKGTPPPAGEEEDPGFSLKLEDEEGNKINVEDKE